MGFLYSDDPYQQRQGVAANRAVQLASTPLSQQTTTATPMTPESIWADPAYLAFQRSVDGSLDAANASHALQGPAARRALEMQKMGIMDQALKGTNRVGTVAAGQGTYASGARLNDQTNIDAQAAGQIAGAEAGYAQNQEEIEAALADKKAQLLQQAAERGLQYAQQAYGNRGT